MKSVDCVLNCIVFLFFLGKREKIDEIISNSIGKLFFASRHKHIQIVSFLLQLSDSYLPWYIVRSEMLKNYMWFVFQ